MSSKPKEEIEYPYRKMYCDKCAYNFDDDMCCAYKIIMSYAYCPQIKECDRFKPRRNRNEE